MSDEASMEGAALPTGAVAAAEVRHADEGASRPATAPRSGGRHHVGHAGRASLDPSLLGSALLAVPILGATLLGARSAPSYVRELVFERGWVQHGILTLTSLSLAMLAWKVVAQRVQRRTLEGELTPPALDRIHPADVPEALEHVDHRRHAVRARRWPRSFVLERARRVLEHFSARGDVEQTAAFATSEADTDAAAVASSLGHVKVLVWAIPILGFIGTVLGIGEAVAGFSRSLQGAERLDAIKGSLGEVTTGLAVAFDTTLLALVASIVVMVPTSLVQRADERLMADVDDRILSRLIRRLSGALPVAEPAAPATVAAPAAREGDLARALEAGLAIPIRQALEEVLSAQTRALTRIAEERGSVLVAQSDLADRLQAFAEAARALGPGVERAVTKLEAATALADRSTEAAQRAQEQLARELGASRRLLELLAAGLGEVPKANGRSNGAHGPGPNGASGANAEV